MKEVLTTHIFCPPMTYYVARAFECPALIVFEGESPPRAVGTKWRRGTAYHWETDESTRIVRVHRDLKQSKLVFLDGSLIAPKPGELLWVHQGKHQE